MIEISVQTAAPPPPDIDVKLGIYHGRRALALFSIDLGADNLC